MNSSTWRIATAFVLMVSAPFLVGAPGRAAEDEEDRKLVTLAVENEPLTDVLREVARQSGKKVAVADDDAKLAAARVTVTLKNATFWEAVADVAKAAGADVHSAGWDHGIELTSATAAPLAYDVGEDMLVILKRPHPKAAWKVAKYAIVRVVFLEYPKPPDPDGLGGYPSVSWRPNLGARLPDGTTLRSGGSRGYPLVEGEYEVEFELSGEAAGKVATVTGALTVTDHPKRSRAKLDLTAGSKYSRGGAKFTVTSVSVEKASADAKPSLVVTFTSELPEGARILNKYLESADGRKTAPARYQPGKAYFGLGEVPTDRKLVVLYGRARKRTTKFSFEGVPLEIPPSR